VSSAVNPKKNFTAEAAKKLPDFTAEGAEAAEVKSLTRYLSSAVPFRDRCVLSGE
jgi:hypothetical protein